MYRLTILCIWCSPLITPLDNSPCSRVPLTYLESLLSVWCDPCPPWSQVACKLTSPSPFFPHSLFPPPTVPNPIMRPSTTTSRHRLHLVWHNPYPMLTVTWFGLSFLLVYRRLHSLPTGDVQIGCLNLGTLLGTFCCTYDPTALQNKLSYAQ